MLNVTNVGSTHVGVLVPDISCNVYRYGDAGHPNLITRGANEPPDDARRPNTAYLPV